MADATRKRVKAKLPLWRRLLKVLGILMLIPLLPALAFLVWNAIDELPSPAALRYVATVDHPMVADADNAWLVLAGLGAAPGDDPVALARRRVAAYAARAALRPTPAADSAEQALFVDPVPAVRPDAVRDGIDALCAARNQDCVQWARTHRSALLRLQRSNALRLQRFEALLQLPAWQVLYPAEINFDHPDMSVMDLHANLIALELAAQGETSGRSNVSAALADLASSIEFWQRVRQAPQDLVSILVSGNQIEQAYLVADAWLNAAEPDAVQRHSASLHQLLAPPSGAVDWDHAMRTDYRGLARTLEDGVPGRWRALRQCFSATFGDKCLETLVTSLFYAPQATLNLHAMHREQMQRVLAASPAQLEAVGADAGVLIEASLPQLGDIDALWPQLRHNYAGRVLAAVAIPKYDWGRREHDREGLRRLLSIKCQARRRGIAPDDMPAFLLAQPEGLHDPMTGLPFEYDREQRELYFVPLADQRWPRERVAVKY